MDKNRLWKIRSTLYIRDVIEVGQYVYTLRSPAQAKLFVRICMSINLIPLSFAFVRVSSLHCILIRSCLGTHKTDNRSNRVLTTVTYPIVLCVHWMGILCMCTNDEYTHTTHTHNRKFLFSNNILFGLVPLFVVPLTLSNAHIHTIVAECVAVRLLNVMPFVVQCIGCPILYSLYIAHTHTKAHYIVRMKGISLRLIDEWSTKRVAQHCIVVLGATPLHSLNRLHTIPLDWSVCRSSEYDFLFESPRFQAYTKVDSRAGEIFRKFSHNFFNWNTLLVLILMHRFNAMYKLSI